MASSSSPSVDVDADQSRDLDALMVWLRTFPRVEAKYQDCHKNNNVLRLLDVDEIATAILLCVEEVCDPNVTNDKTDTQDTEIIWTTISEIIAEKMPQVSSETAKAMKRGINVWDNEMRIFLLSSLLCFAVSEQCKHQERYVHRILGVAKCVQEVLRSIIKRGQQSTAVDVAEPPTDDRTPPTQSKGRLRLMLRNEDETSNKKSGSKRNLKETCTDQETLDTPSEPCAKRPSQSDDRKPVDSTSSKKSWAANDAFASPSVMIPEGYTPRSLKSNRRLSVDSLFSTNTIDSSLETLVADLRRQNKSLQAEVASSQQRETELGQKMEASEVAFRREMMKLESTSLQREEEAREAHQQEMKEIREQLEGTRAALEKEQRAHKELESVRDEMDVLKGSQKRLVETEDKLRLCRERLEQMGDVKKALSREEEAHAARVEECLRLENEISALQPLRRQLQDYKTRAVEAEVKLAECQEDLKRMETVTGNLSSVQKAILAGAKVHKEEAEDLRHRLLLKEENDSEDGPSVAEGLSELNPVVMEELARLRNENIQLKAFAAARQDDEVQLLGERFDDSQRLSERFKEQFLTTKHQLDQTEQKLRASEDNVTHLNEEVQDLAKRLEEVGQELDESKSQLSKERNDLARTSQLLEESKGREVSLRSDVEQLRKETSETNNLAAKHLEQLECTELKLEETAAFLKTVQEEEQRLNEEVDEWTGKTEAAETAFLQCEHALDETKKLLEEATTSLDAALDRETSLKGAMTDLETANKSLGEKLEEGALSAEAALLAVETERNDMIRSLKEKSKHELEQVKESMSTLLQSERATFEEKLATALEEHLNFKEQSAHDLSQLQEKHKRELQQTTDENQQAQQQLKESFDREIASLEQAAAEEREKLIEKGKSMLKKAKVERTNAETQLQSKETKLVELCNKYEDYEKKTNKKLANYKKKNGIASTRIAELSQENDTLEDKVKDLEREKFKLQEENERFRQLGSRYGADDSLQNQLEVVTNELSAVLEENRELKKARKVDGDSNFTTGLSSISEADEADSRHTSYKSLRESQLTQVRKDYEETTENLKDEMRELIMMNSKLKVDVQKAEQRAWESDNQVRDLEGEVTSLKLKLQRFERVSNDFYDARSGSFHDEIKENPHHAREGLPADPTMAQPATLSSSTNTKKKECSSADKRSSPEENLLDLSSYDDRGHPLVESTNEKRHVEDSAVNSSRGALSKAANINAYEFPTAQEMAKSRTPPGDDKSETSKKASQPSLMDYARSSTDDAQSECKQS